MLLIAGSARRASFQSASRAAAASAFGILLLCGVGAYLLFAGLSDRRRDQFAVLDGIGLALTFDEFGMWLHLGGGYWQRASWDAICVSGAALALVAFAPRLANFERRHWIVTLILAVLMPDPASAQHCHHGNNARPDQAHSAGRGKRRPC
jgi:hypothetical protein